MNRTNYIALLVALVLFSCGKQEEPTSFGTEYFPIEVGKYKCYAMESIEYDAFLETADTTYFYIRETIDSEFLDNSNEQAFRLRIEKSIDTTLGWNFESYGVVKKDDYSAQLVLNDTRFVKLSFPVRNRKSWDENEYNTLNKQTNRYTDVDEPFELNGVTYPTTLIVDRGDSEDPYFRFFGREVYVLGKGLILEEYINTETQQGKTKGNAYTKTLLSTNW